jgi:hypothetical protein
MPISETGHQGWEASNGVPCWPHLAPKNHVDGSGLFVKFRARLTDLESSKLLASNKLRDFRLVANALCLQFSAKRVGQSW